MSSSTPSTPKTPKTPKTPQGDRFIPKRNGIDGDLVWFNLTNENSDPQSPASAAKRTPAKDLYRTALKASMLGPAKGPAKILTLQAESPKTPAAGHLNTNRILYTQNRISDYSRTAAVHRYIPHTPEKILDAPELMADYYLNLLDWSSTNLLAVALGQTIYLWNASNGEITQLCETTREDDHVTSVSWIHDGSYLAVGTNQAEVQIWDVAAQKQVRAMRGHRARIGALAWNTHILSSGSRDSAIINHDVRVAQHAVARLEGHTQEVCGLKWSPNGKQLASGGNDNLLNVWDGADTQAPRHQIAHHQAAVKALAWSPHQANLLASGGGTADRKICLWNSVTGAMLQEMDTNSQVCSLLWNPHEKELLSSHGFNQNQLTLWKYPSMTKVAELTGHQSRVLHLAISPDGNTVVSGAADETLRFWKVFGSDGSKRDRSKDAFTSASLARAASIR